MVLFVRSCLITTHEKQLQNPGLLRPYLRIVYRLFGMSCADSFPLGSIGSNPDEHTSIGLIQCKLRERVRGRIGVFVNDSIRGSCRFDYENCS